MYLSLSFTFYLCDYLLLYLYVSNYLFIALTRSVCQSRAIPGPQVGGFTGRGKPNIYMGIIYIHTYRVNP